MSELSGPADHSLMRVSDSDREQAADVLREAAGHGRITMDELDERLELAYAAKTYADLAAVTKDLPQPGQVPGVAQPVATSRIGGTPRYKFSIAIMSGFDHNASGPGVPGAPQVRVIGFALMGGVDVKRKPLDNKKGKRVSGGTRDAVTDG